MLTFNLENARRACTPGGDQARHLFEPGRDYTLPELIEMGLFPQYLAWLLFARAKQDSSTVPLIQAWARRCCAKQKLRSQSFDTPDQCQAAITAAMRQWARGRPTAKGALEWTYAELIDLIHSEGF